MTVYWVDKIQFEQNQLQQLYQQNIKEIILFYYESNITLI